jgi:purine-binding chemotaxis protein CheW
VSDVRAADADAARERPRVDGNDYVTVMVADQIFGIPIGSVHDVFVAGSVTRVPLAQPEIVGLINLRGRVITGLCLRRRLGLPDSAVRREMAIGLEHRGEVYGLFVDRVGEVMRLAADTREPNPVHMDPQWSSLSRGVHRLDRLLLIILDVDAVLALEAPSRAA